MLNAQFISTLIKAFTSSTKKIGLVEFCSALSKENMFFLILGVVVQHFQSELIFLNKQKLCMASSVYLSDFLLPSGLAVVVEELLE